MSAIAGLIRFDSSSVDSATIERIENILRPYGRDAQHHWCQGGATFIHTLLRTTPEESLDRQPLYHAASDSCLLFDGRLDNREDLSRELGLDVAAAALLADSDLVLQAVLRWQMDAVHHLIGNFALACWCERERTLWLARDPLGFRPLFWHQHNGFFAFASLPKALFTIPGISRELSEERLADLLLLLPMIGPETFFKGIYRVEPGQVLILKDNQVTTRRYHSFDPKREIHLPSDDDYLQAFQERVEQAVASCLRSNGPIVSHLSSGFDSSTVTALAAAQLAKQGQRLTAYTAVPRPGFNGLETRGRHGDEGPVARVLAEKFANIDHVLIDTVGTSPIDNLQDNIEELDRAPLNPCNMVWGEAISADAVRRGARVLLTGQMGNMTISYTGEQYLPALLGKGQLVRWWQEASALKKAQPHRRWRGFAAQSLGPYLPAWLWALIEKYRNRGWHISDYTAIHPDFLKGVGQERIHYSQWDTSYRPWADGRRMRIAVLNRLDIGEHWLAANHKGLDMRDPTSDLRLIEFCLAVPDHQYLRNGQTRWLLKRMMGNILPPQILNATTKGLQAADWYESVVASADRMKELLKQHQAHGKIGQYLDLETVLKDLEELPDSGWEQDRVMKKYRLKLLRGLSVAEFIRYVEPDNS